MPPKDSDDPRLKHLNIVGRGLLEMTEESQWLEKASPMEREIFQLLRVQGKPIREVGLAFFFEKNRRAFRKTISSLEKQGKVKRILRGRSVWWLTV